MRIAWVPLFLVFATVTTAQAEHELGVRAGGLDDFYLGVEWQTPARMPGNLLAPTDTPTPLPQTTTARSASPLRTASQASSA